MAQRIAQRIGDRLVRDGVAHPQPREAVRLRERPEDADARPVAVEGDAVGHVRVTDELAVRLVDDHQHLRRHCVEEPLEPVARDRRAGRVVRRAHQDQPGAVGDRGEHRVEVVLLGRGQRHLDAGRAGDLGDDRVCLERPPRVDHLVARTNRGLDDLLGHPNRPGADGNVACRDVEAVRDRVHQVGREHVRVAVRPRAGVGDLGQHARQRRVRVLVRRQLERPPRRVGRGHPSGSVRRNAVEGRPEAGSISHAPTLRAGARWGLPVVSRIAALAPHRINHREIGWVRRERRAAAERRNPGPRSGCRTFTEGAGR